MGCPLSLGCLCRLSWRVIFFSCDYHGIDDVHVSIMDGPTKNKEQQRTTNNKIKKKWWQQHQRRQQGRAVTSSDGTGAAKDNENNQSATEEFLDLDHVVACLITPLSNPIFEKRVEPRQRNHSHRLSRREFGEEREGEGSN